MPKRVAVPIIAMQLVVASVWVIALDRADAAMDKSGIGNLEQFNYWNNCAGIAFYSFVSVWCLALVGLVAKSIRKHRSLAIRFDGYAGFVIGGAPLLAVLATFLSAYY